MYVELKQTNTVFLKKTKIIQMNYIIASIRSHHDLRKKVTTSEEDYYTKIELERRKSTVPINSTDSKYADKHNHGCCIFLS